jgi:tetratricopeptide (TPR) repeat protein
MALALIFGVAFGSGCDTVKARMLAREGSERFHAGDFAAAVSRYERAAELDPRAPALLLNAGTAHLSIFRGSPANSPESKSAAEGAIRNFERYLASRPRDERAKSSLIQTFADTRRYEEAVAFFRPATEASPPDTAALTTLAAIAQKCGKFDEARQWHHRRIAAEPKSAEARLALGTLLWQYLHDHPDMPPSDRLAMVDEALGALDKAIELQPAAPHPYTYANLVYREKAVAFSTDDEKRPCLEAANRFYEQALARQKGGT